MAAQAKPSVRLDTGFAFELILRFSEATVKLEEILPRDDSVTGAKLIAKQGKAPAQYGNSDDGW